jgi:hypothetical protein
VYATNAPKAEKIAIPRNVSVEELAVSKSKPMKGGAIAIPVFRHIPSIPKPVPDELGPNINGGSTLTMGGTNAAEMPKATIEIIIEVSDV